LRAGWRLSKPSPDPNEAENLAELAELVVREKCDVGIAFDGDGDRIGIVDEKGE
jgi:phosphomannomutase